MRHRSALYGLVVESDIALAGVAPRADAIADVRVHVGALPPSLAPGAPLEGEFHRTATSAGEPPVLIADRPAGGTLIRLSYAEGIRFHLRPDGSEVWCDWDRPLTEDDATTFLLGPVLGLVLRRRGVLALHASAVVHAGEAWAFVGPGGSGKSTLAAALAGRGFPVLTEDILALRPVGDRWLAWPAYDHIRLWEDSPALDATESAALPNLSPTWGKRRLDLDHSAQRRAREPVPLAGAFLLEGREGSASGRQDADREADHHAPIGRIHGADALRGLIENSYVNYLMDDASRAAELRALAAVAGSCALYRLRAGSGARGLEATVAAIAQALTSHSASPK